MLAQPSRWASPARAAGGFGNVGGMPTIPPDRFIAVFRVAATSAIIERRAQAIAVEQSVEMPVAAIRDARILDGIVGRVAAIEPDGEAHFRVSIALALATTGFEPGQFLNMAFGNTSMQPDVELLDLLLPDALLTAFPGPRFGIAGVRELTGAHGRALTSSALKPQGLDPAALARLAGTFARAGIDVIKDDHGIANQAYAPFAERVPVVQRAVDEANAITGGRSVYAPTLSGGPSALMAQAKLAQDVGVRMVLVAPMLSGMPVMAELVREHLTVPVLAHPSFAGALRIAPALLLGMLFRLFGADAVIFPNHGGRFAYDPDTCRAIARRATQSLAGVAPAIPVPAGGMPVERVDEMIGFYGRDVMLLVGGGLLQAGDALPSVSAAFVERVRRTSQDVT